MSAAGPTSELSVSDAGIRFADAPAGSVDIEFDGRRIWSFSAAEAAAGRTVAWPRNLRRFLDGWSDVRVLVGEQELFAGRVAFGSGTDQVRLVDGSGVPIIIDKWGFVQRPFELRGSGVVEAVIDHAEEIIRLVREECGIELWLAFGSLLGAARAGKVIGHDSDVDLAFLSERSTPAEMATEIWHIARVLRRHGMKVDVKTGAFITVELRTPDGAVAGIDVYTTFLLDGVLHETATVRWPVPRSAILPLGTLTFEGRELPVPADPDTLLTVSYGPGWRTPDPSFQHKPGPEITRRFDGWFGSLWRFRRAWRAINRAAAETAPQPTDFASWVLASIAPRARVVELGSGAGADLAHYGRSGHKTLGLDYAHPARKPEGTGTVVTRENLNFYDERDVLVRGALLARYPGRQVLVARDLVETLEPVRADAFVQLVRMGLRRGGDLFLEGVSYSPQRCHAWAASANGARLRSLDPHDVAAELEAAGGRVVERDGFAAARSAVQSGGEARWRMLVRWPVPAATSSAADRSETPA